MDWPPGVDAVFLPGILMSAVQRYEPLLAALNVPGAVTKELDVYAGDRPPDGYTLETEVEGLDRFADERGLDRFHLYGHSAGASIALAYAASHGDRVVSLALDEPASDFSAHDRAEHAALPNLAGLPVPERMRTFAASLVRPGVALPEPAAPPGLESVKRPAGLAVFEVALYAYELPSQGYAAFTGPVLYTYGSLSNSRWELMAERLQRQFRTIEVERFDGLHHLNASHVAQPARVAAALRTLWTLSGGTGSTPG
jgi:pimeloyl-ACP methyl ester carboxylesterase